MTLRDLSLVETRKIDLLNAAGELLAQKPTASLAEIAEYAGIGKATLHRYFASREDLMVALAQRALMVIRDAIVRSELERGSAVDAFTRMIEMLMPLGDKVFLLLNDNGLQDHPELADIEAPLTELVVGLIQRGQASGELRADLNAEWIARYLDYALFAAWKAVHDGSIARNDAARLLVTTLLGGIATRRATS
ncbi:MAG: helix-turn-helix domain-containing protein [Chloroflexota bacterium]|nr:helix-turn-helix domain-containing protein [Chloroflexota bacterium]